MNSPGNGKKGRAKTRIFACLCPCSVFEYVDTDGNLGNIKKKDIGKVGSFNAMDSLDQNQRPTRDTNGKGAFSRIPPGAPTPCGQPAQARKPCADSPKPGFPGQRHGPLGRGFQTPGQPPPQCPPKMPPSGDSMLKKPLKIVMEEIDCSKLDFSHCPKPCPPQPCPLPKSCPIPCPPPPCPPPQTSCNSGCNEHSPQHGHQHQGHHQQQHQHQQQNQGSRQHSQNQQQNNKCCRPCCEQKQEPPCCPPPPCPLPQCPEPCDPCGQKHEQPQQDCCPPQLEVMKRFEMKLDKSGKLVNQCTPAGSPTILKVEKDETCPTETTIKITYCAKGTEGGKGDEDQDGEKGGKRKDSHDEKDHHRNRKKNGSKSSKDGEVRREASKDSKHEKHRGSKEDKKKGGASEGEKTEDESHDELKFEVEHKSKRSRSLKSPTAMMALSSPYGESSCSSLEQILAIQSTEALLQKLARKSGNFGIRTDEFEAIACPSELGKLCERPQTSIAQAKPRVSTRSKSGLRVGKVIKPSNYRRSDPISNIVVRETQVIPKAPTKSPVHLLFGTSEAASSAVQMRRRNMRVYCTSSIKREVRPSSTSKRRFKETRV